MQRNLQITFRNLEITEPLELAIRQNTKKLERFCSRVTACHVTVSSPDKHRQHGRRHVVHIEILVPGSTIVVDHAPRDHRSKDAYAAIGAAFDRAARLLEEYVRVQRGDVKRHREPMVA